jgi:soluble lytic murein transglycosylase-like protein
MNKFIILCSIWYASLAHGIDPLLVTAMVEVESSYRPQVVNKNCIGLLQVDVNVWGSELGVTRQDLLDPWNNLDAGLRILALYYKQTGDIDKALMRYNAGYKYDGRPYVRKVRNVYHRLQAQIKEGKND